MNANLESITQHDESADCVAFLREVSIFQQRVATALKPLDLSLRELEVLQCLAGGPLHQSTIKDRLKSYKASVSRRLCHLTGHGWVSGKHPPNDQRVCVLELTADGRARLEQARLLIASLLDELNTSLGDKEQRLLIRIKDYLTRLLSARSEEGSV